MLELPEIDFHNCSQCSYRTSWITQLDRHIARNHTDLDAGKLFHADIKPEQLSCLSCRYQSHFRFNLYEHCKQAHNPNSQSNRTSPVFEEIARYVCKRCQFKSDSGLPIVKHDVFCEMVAKKRTKNVTGYMECQNLHQATTSAILGSASFHSFEGPWESHDDKPKDDEINWLQCTSCSFQTITKPILNRHVMFKHASDEEINWLHCKNCSFRTKVTSNLNRHMLKHAANDEINWFQCDSCPFRTKMKWDLKRHELQHAPDEEVEWFQCELCPYRGRLKTYLQMHLLRHAGAASQKNTEHRCTHCPYRTTKKANLTRHLANKHAADEDVVWFGCVYCPHRSKLKSNLEKHMLTHAADEEVEWFQCDHCSYRAKQRSYLQTHMLKHAAFEEGAWCKCDHCPYRTIKKANLKRHMLQHAANDGIA